MNLFEYNTGDYREKQYRDYMYKLDNQDINDIENNMIIIKKVVIEGNIGNREIMIIKNVNYSVEHPEVLRLRIKTHYEKLFKLTNVRVLFSNKIQLI